MTTHTDTAHAPAGRVLPFRPRTSRRVARAVTALLRAVWNSTACSGERTVYVTYPTILALDARCPSRTDPEEP